jgi:hypothetical protein
MLQYDDSVASAFCGAVSHTLPELLPLFELPLLLVGLVVPELLLDLLELLPEPACATVLLGFDAALPPELPLWFMAVVDVPASGSPLALSLL